eukprot:1161045-Pelagomonas_calceolata.AAC.22
MWMHGHEAYMCTPSAQAMGLMEHAMSVCICWQVYDGLKEFVEEHMGELFNPVFQTPRGVLALRDLARARGQAIYEQFYVSLRHSSYVKEEQQRGLINNLKNGGASSLQLSDGRPAILLHSVSVICCGRKEREENGYIAVPAFKCS